MNVYLKLLQLFFIIPSFVYERPFLSFNLKKPKCKNTKTKIAPEKTNIGSNSFYLSSNFININIWHIQINMLVINATIIPVLEILLVIWLCNCEGLFFSFINDSWFFTRMLRNELKMTKIDENPIKIQK